MRHLIDLTDEEIIARFEEFTSVDEVDDLVFTRETLDDFRAARDGYAERGSVYCDIDGVLNVEKVQVRRGDQRRDLTVIDFGEVRAARFW